MTVESALEIRAFKGTPLALIIVTSLTVNGLLIKVICSDIRMRTTTNMFLLSQSIADVATTLLVMIPSFVAVLGDKWLLGDTLCQVHGFLNLYFTIITLLNLAMLALDRYFAIVRVSLKTYALAKKTALYIACAVWSVAFIGAFPWAACFGNNNNVKIEFFRGFYVCGTTYKQPMSAYSLTVIILSITTFAFAPFAVVVFSFYQIMKTVRRRRLRVCPSIVSNQLRIAIDLYARSAYTSLLIIVTSLVFVFPACFSMTFDGLQIVHIDQDFETALKWLMWLHCVIKPLICATKQSFVRRKYKSSPIVFALTKSKHCKALIRKSFYNRNITHNTTPSTRKITTASHNFSDFRSCGEATEGIQKPRQRNEHSLTDKIKPTKQVALKKAWSLDSDVGFNDINLDIECSPHLAKSTE